VLEGLGWRICRIWSTDWVHDPEKQVRRVLTALELARHAPSSPPAVVTTASINRQKPERDPGAASEAAVTALPAAMSYESIEDVPEPVVKEIVCEALRAFGATESGELIQFVTRRLGFRRTGRRIQSRIEKALAALIRSGQIRQTSDDRLQLADGPQAVTG
jgi:hypothetical protein